MIDRVTGIVEAVRHRFEDELRQQLQSLTSDHQRELDQVRQLADQEAQTAEIRWAEMLAGARTEWQQQVETAVTAARQEYEAEREAERETQRRVDASDAEAIGHLVAALDRCRSLTDVLDHLAGAANRPGGALLVVQGETIRPWRQPGGSSDAPLANWEGLVDAVVRDRHVHRRTGTTAVPLIIDGVVVGVLVSPEGKAYDVAPELLAAAGSARLTALTASRLVQAERWTRTAAAGVSAPAARAPETRDAADDPSLSARRYARLLISEIKLYNETAVREGREHRDLARRLGSEITRARQIYEARVPPDVPGRAGHFQEELVRTLADGDASLLA